MMKTVSVKKTRKVHAGNTNSDRSNDLGERSTNRRSRPNETTTKKPASTGLTIHDSTIGVMPPMYGNSLFFENQVTAPPP